MASLLNKFVSKIDFESYEDFEKNFRIIVPEEFNFAYDVVDEYAAKDPEKIAMVWCDDNSDRLLFLQYRLQKVSLTLRYVEQFLSFSLSC